MTMACPRERARRKGKPPAVQDYRALDGAMAWLSFREGAIDLKALEGDGTRSGKGSALLTRIMAIADEFDLEIEGNPVAVDTPARNAGLSDEALLEFYRRHGFEVWCGAEKLWHLRYCPRGAKPATGYGYRCV